LRRKIEDVSGERVTACFQCEKCSNGCPVTFAMDIMPHLAMRLLALGQVDEVLRSDTIWVCATCETCATRCPNDIEIAHVMDALRQMCRREGVTPSQKAVPVFHETFLSSIRRYGRVHEPTMAAAFALRNGGIGGLLKQAGTGLAMFTRGKISIIPERLRGRKQVGEIFERTLGKG
jgi:heterodisulfide reductase subunit C